MTLGEAMPEALLLSFGIFGAGFATGYVVRAIVSQRRRAQRRRLRGVYK